MDHEPSVKTALQRVASIYKIVTTRYRSLIFAANCEKAVLALAYEPKVDAVADRLGVPEHKSHRTIPIEFAEIKNLQTLRPVIGENLAQLFEVLP